LRARTGRFPVFLSRWLVDAWPAREHDRSSTRALIHGRAAPASSRFGLQRAGASPRPDRQESCSSGLAERPWACSSHSVVRASHSLAACSCSGRTTLLQVAGTIMRDVSEKTLCRTSASRSSSRDRQRQHCARRAARGRELGGRGVPCSSPHGRQPGAICAEVRRRGLWPPSVAAARLLASRHSSRRARSPLRRARSAFDLARPGSRSGVEESRRSSWSHALLRRADGRRLLAARAELHVVAVLFR